MLRRLKSNAPRVADITSFQVSHSGESFAINLIRSPTARRYTLRVRAATRDVVLTMPARGSLAQARAFAERHAAWVATRLQRLPERTPFGPGEMLPLRGVLHRIVHVQGRASPVWITAGDAHDAMAMPFLCVSGEPPHIARRIRDFLIREARRDLETAVSRHGMRLGLTAKRITLRDTTSRWGSCSASGSLNFSWRLIMAPGFVLDYLAAHEVAHLRHMNHSSAFWQVVAQLTPDVDNAEAWLKAHGRELLRYEPGDC
ncbi:MAG TPA: SprT family zinc-dependent metalloprotease [Beijerinckia sp.]|jgi:predicted metal-dependent hydrolase|nr:SprT family zinc-dependent metalloprotease [Beijerinckia sp.]